jgi:recombination protein RecA
MAKEVKLTLDQAKKQLEKDYGKGSVISGRDITTEYDVIDTGSIGLNHVLNIGGIPTKGKLIEIIGWESSGKSTLVQHIVANAQKKFKLEGKGKKVLYVDGENSLDRTYATAIGIDMDDLLIIQLDAYGGEGAYNKAEVLIKTGDIGLVVYDSYNSLQPKKLMEGEVGDSTMGIHSRMLGQAVMKANSLAVEYGTTFIFIGQLREKIGVMYGSPETTQGGNALKFYTQIRLQVTRSTIEKNSIMNGDEKIGNKVTIKVLKTKFGAPFLKTELDIVYGIGMDKFGELVRLGKEYDVFKLRAGIVTYEDIKYPEAEFRQLISDNEEFSTILKAKIMVAMKAAPVIESIPSQEEEES